MQQVAHVILLGLSGRYVRLTEPDMASGYSPRLCRWPNRSHRKQGRERADAARNRARVLAAAERLFAERGAADVTMEDIARAAGVGRGTLYRRYPDRAAIAVALLDEHERSRRSGSCAATHRWGRSATRRATGRLLHRDGGPAGPPRPPGARRGDRSVPLHDGRLRFLARPRAALAEAACAPDRRAGRSHPAPLAPDLFLHATEHGITRDRFAATLHHLAARLLGPDG